MYRKLCELVFDVLEKLDAPDWCYAAWRFMRDLPRNARDFITRPNTIAARTLSYHRHDKSDVLPHIMFEILQRFYDEEVYPHSYVEWGFHKIKFGNGEWAADEVFKWLLDWWRHYLAMENYDYAYHIQLRELWAKHGFNMLNEKSDTQRKMMDRYNKKVAAREKMLEENLILLIQLRSLLWT